MRTRATTAKETDVEHELKTWPEPFAAVRQGEKLHEVRRADRPFAVGDTLHLREWLPVAGRYTGEVVDVLVTHITSGAFGVPDDLAVMSIRLLAADDKGERVTAADVAEVLRLDAAATKGPWYGVGPWSNDVGICAAEGWQRSTLEDRAFMRALRTLGPRLAREVERLTSERDALRANAIAGWTSAHGAAIAHGMQATERAAASALRALRAEVEKP